MLDLYCLPEYIPVGVLRAGATVIRGEDFGPPSPDVRARPRYAGIGFGPRRLPPSEIPLGVYAPSATRAAAQAATAAGLPVLAWALPTAIADRLRAETGQPFTGQPPDRLDLCIRVDRARQRRAALMHASQISPAAVVWRRWQMQGDCEHLRWLLPPRAT